MKVDIGEMILEHIKTPEDQRPALSEHQQKTFLRVMSLCSLLERHRVDKEVIDIYREIELSKGEEVSIASAYRHLDLAKYVRGNLSEIVRKYERIALADWQRKIMQKAEAIDDFRSFNSGVANIIKLLGLDRPDPIPVDYSKLTPVQPIFGFFTDLFDNEFQTDEELLQELQELQNPKKYQKSNVGEYVDYEEVDGAKHQESPS